jgi:hypothetical protein
VLASKEIGVHTAAVASVTEQENHACTTWDLATRRLTLTKWENESLDPPIKIDISEEALREHFETIGSESNFLYPLDPPIDAGFKLFQVHMVETIIMRATDANTLKLSQGVLLAVRD